MQAFEHRLIRGRESSGQLRANKRYIFKIAFHILEMYLLLLRSCYLNTVYTYLECETKSILYFLSHTLFLYQI